MTMLAPSPDPTSLYVYRDRYGVVIYVGITRRGTSRQQEHHDKAWWPHVTSQAVQHFDSRGAAEVAEREAILTYRPPFNVQHHPGHQEAHAAYLSLLEHGPEADPLARFRELPARRLRLYQLSDTPTLTFRTDLCDVALASGLHLRPPTRCREHRGPFLTRVTRIDHRGPFALIVCARERYTEWRWAEAVLRWDTKSSSAWVQSVQVAA